MSQITIMRTDRGWPFAALVLAVLRRKIDEAPVVAWKHHYEDYSNRIARAPDNVASFSVPLISKEDLQK